MTLHEKIRGMVDEIDHGQERGNGNAIKLSGGGDLMLTEFDQLRLGEVVALDG